MKYNTTPCSLTYVTVLYLPKHFVFKLYHLQVMASFRKTDLCNVCDTDILGWLNVFVDYFVPLLRV